MARKWLQQAIDQVYLPAIASLENTPEGQQQAAELNQQIRQDWSDRGLGELSQQQGLSDELRRYLKDKLGDDHWVLDYLGLSTGSMQKLTTANRGAWRQGMKRLSRLRIPMRSWLWLSS
jgi:hypothetical protein